MAAIPHANSQDDPLLRPLRTDQLVRSQGNTQDSPEGGENISGVGVPYSAVMRDVLPPYHNALRDARLSGDSVAILGDSAMKFHVNFFNGLRLNTPLTRGLRPETSELKLGNFYLDLQSVSASMLFSDNIKLSHDNRESDVLAALRANVGALYQMGDYLRFGLKAAFVYLPLQNSFGVAGFGINDFYAMLDQSPLAQAEIAYDMYLGKWQVELMDKFGIYHQRFGVDTDFEFFDGVTFDDQEQAGRYRISNWRNYGAGSGSGDDRRSERMGSELIHMNNTVGGIATRMLPTEARMEIGAFHSDSWYQNRRGEDGLPGSHDRIFMNLISERDSLRFKPFLRYRAYHYERENTDRNPWHQEARVGAQGPISEYLSVLGDFGYTWSDSSEREGYVWRLRLEHNPRPLLYHRLQYSRHLTEPESYMEERWSYRIRYQINEDLRSEMFAEISDYEDLDNSNTGGQEWRTGIRFTYNLAQRTLLQIGAVWNQAEPNGASPCVRTLTARAEVRYRHTETLDSTLIYRFRDRDSDDASSSYYENLVFYMLTKYF